MCDIHSGEEFVYYHPLKQKLLCSNCLLTDIDPNTLNEVKPIKKCLPEIMDDFNCIFEKVELRMKLNENRRRDIELKK